MIRKTPAAAAAVAFLFALLPAAALAVDSVSVEAGAGEDVFLLRAGAQWNWQRRWFLGRGWELGGYWDLSAGAWYNDEHRTIYDLGLTPVFRIERKSLGATYFEAAIGLHLLSDRRVESDRTLGSSFQFGDHIAVGRRFGPGRRHDLSLRLQHLSNAGIRKPNPGINFLQLRFQYHLN